MSTWIFWLGIVLVNVGGIFSGYAWYGKILGLVEKEKAKRIWIGGAGLKPLGLIQIFMLIALGTLPETGV